MERQLTDLGNDSGINDNSAAIYSGTTQEPEPGAVQHPGYRLLSPAQTQPPGWLSPVSDSDVSIGESSRSVVSGLLSPRLSDLYATYGDLPSEHEESSSSDSEEDLDSIRENSRSVVTGLLSPSLSATYGDLPNGHEESSSSSDEDLDFSDN